MTYRGHIEKGVVVFDDPTPPPEGTEVTVNVAPQTDTKRTWDQVRAQMTGGWEPGERERLLDELQQFKQEDLQRQIDSGKWDRSL